MNQSLVDYLCGYGFVAQDVAALSSRCKGDLRTPNDIKALLDSYGYDYEWEREYIVQSALVSARGETLSCINAAILAYTMLGGLADPTRTLLAIHRRDPQGVECGHVVAIGEYQNGIYAFGKSNYPALSRVYGPFACREEAAMAFGRAYTSMNFTPLYFGFFKPEMCCPEEELTGSPVFLNHLCDFMISNYQYAFSVTAAA